MKWLRQFWKDFRMVPQVAQLREENRALRSQVSEMLAQRQKQQSANKALLTFIHRAHRLNVPFADGSLRTMLYKAQSTRHG